MEQHLKPWGKEVWLLNDEEADHCQKHLHINKGSGISWHFHKVKSEIFLVLEGKVLIEYGETPTFRERTCKVLEPGEFFYVPTGLIHTVAALEDSIIFEESTFHRDEDSIRVA